MNVLFLCSSNIFRSQIAEAFLNTYAKQSKAESAALHTPQNNMHALVVRAMKEKGIDISHQKSKKLTQKLTKWADLIILMNANLKFSNKEKLIEVWNIPDIVAKETDEHLYPDFVKVRDMIENKVRDLIKRIES